MYASACPVFRQADVSYFIIFPGTAPTPVCPVMAFLELGVVSRVSFSSVESIPVSVVASVVLVVGALVVGWVVIWVSGIVVAAVVGAVVGIVVGIVVAFVGVLPLDLVRQPERSAARSATAKTVCIIDFMISLQMCLFQILKLATLFLVI